MSNGPAPSNHTNANADTASDTDENETDASGEARKEIHELLGELRAEVTRLKAEEARARAQNWIQRHPLFTVVISVGVGAAAGYGASQAFRPRRPQPLSKRVRKRLRGIGGDAQELAARLRDRLKERAAQSGTNLRNRAEETRRRLSEEAQKAGEQARQEAKEVADQASKQARSFSQDASERFREATGEAKRRLSERRSEAVEGARELGEKIGETASETIQNRTGGESKSDRGRPFARSLMALAGLAAGGYLASKVRRWS